MIRLAVFEFATFEPSTCRMVQTFNLTVNGSEASVSAREDTPLLYILRNDLKLKGARFGCGLGQCGSCTVLMDNKSVQSCTVPLWMAVGKQIVTIEGLGQIGKLHPLQQAFIDEQAAQCGYCVSGIIMGAVALLLSNPNASELEIRSGMNLHLCRCGVQGRMVRAILRAARQLSPDGEG